MSEKGRLFLITAMIASAIGLVGHLLSQRKPPFLHSSQATENSYRMVDIELEAPYWPGSFMPGQKQFSFPPNSELVAVPGMANASTARDFDRVVVPILSVQTGETVQVLETEEMRFFPNSQVEPAQAGSVAFSPDGTLVALGTYYNNQYINYLWPVSAGNVPPAQWRATGQNCLELAFSADGEFVICPEVKLRASDGQPVPLEATDELALSPQAAPINPNESPIFAPDGSFELSAEWNPREVELPYRFEVRDSEEGAVELMTPGMTTTYLSSGLISPDSEKIAIFTGSRAEVSIWRREGSLLKRVFLTSRTRAVSWSPDSNIFAATVDRTILLFDVP